MCQVDEDKADRAASQTRDRRAGTAAMAVKMGGQGHACVKKQESVGRGS